MHVSGRKDAFTLIEISIVLVLIGLLVGGVLVGRDLIQAAALRKQIGQIEQIKASINVFRLKYNCLPGDCKHAGSFGLGTSGNGDNIVKNGGDTAASPGYGRMLSPRWVTAYNGEAINFFYHMQRGGLLAEGGLTGFTSPFTDMADYFPKMTIRNSGVIRAITFRNRTNMLVLSGFDPGSAAQEFVLTAGEAYVIDLKADDGLPHAGKVRVMRQGNDGVILEGTEIGCANALASPGYDIRAEWYKPVPHTPDPDPRRDKSRLECNLAIMDAF